MITFLPSRYFTGSAKILDMKRLGKQRIEARQILSTLSGESEAWANHPAVRMWRGYEKQLAYYGKAMCLEWINRGYNDHTLYYFEEYLGSSNEDQKDGPPWLGNELVHSSHRAALLFKKPNWYSRYNWTEKPKINYYWPC
jgi:hypothetical protein